MDYIAVIVAALAYLILGMIWYSKPVFGKMWMEFTGKKEMKASASSMLLGLFAAIIMSLVLSLAMDIFAPENVLAGAAVGVVMAIGFVLTTSLGMVLWEHRPAGLYLLNSAYYVIALGFMGGIIAAMS